MAVPCPGLEGTRSGGAPSCVSGKSPPQTVAAALGIADGSGREGRGLPSDIRVGVSGDLGGASSGGKERLAAEVSRPSWGEELGNMENSHFLQTSFSAEAGKWNESSQERWGQDKGAS